MSSPVYWYTRLSNTPEHMNGSGCDFRYVWLLSWDIFVKRTNGLTDQGISSFAGGYTLSNVYSVFHSEIKKKKVTIFLWIFVRRNLFVISAFLWQSVVLWGTGRRCAGEGEGRNKGMGWGQLGSPRLFLYFWEDKVYNGSLGVRVVLQNSNTSILAVGCCHGTGNNSFLLLWTHTRRFWVTENSESTKQANHHPIM